MAPELDFDPKSDTLKKFLALSLLTGKFKLSPKKMKSMVEDGKNTLTKWISE